jgi:hypothetical protein
MWDLWWTKWRWGRFSSSTLVSPANLHSTNFSTITITYHSGLVQQASSGCGTQSPTAQIKKKAGKLQHFFFMRHEVTVFWTDILM